MFWECRFLEPYRFAIWGMELGSLSSVGGQSFTTVIVIRKTHISPTRKLTGSKHFNQKHATLRHASESSTSVNFTTSSQGILENIFLGGLTQAHLPAYYVLRMFFLGYVDFVPRFSKYAFLDFRKEMRWIHMHLIDFQCAFSFNMHILGSLTL